MSFTKGLSFHHETNSSSNPNITNNISINASNEMTNTNPSVIIETSNEPEKVESSEPSAVERENEFLKKVLNIYMNQKLYWENKTLVLSPDELLDLIQTLIPEKGVVITTNDIDDPGCCGFIKDAPIKKVDSIWVTSDDSESNFKYVYSNLVALLDNYRISIKFVRLQ